MPRSKNATRPCRVAIPFALTAVLLAQVAEAADTSNCSNPISQSEMTRCAYLDFEAADKILNTTYRRAISAMKDMDRELPGDLKGAEQALRVAQRAWVDFRDKACASYRFIARGGSMEPMLAAMCLADLTRKRTKALKEFVGETGR